MTSFYSEEELAQLGLKSYGSNVLISRFASIYSPHTIEIGSNVRIDDFCILSGKISIGNYIHIAAYVGLFAGKAGIKMEDYSAVSSRSVIYAESDDYDGNYFTNPMLPSNFRNVYGGEVVLEKHVIIGSGTTILPQVTIKEGCAVGSMSLVVKNLDSWGIYVGIPCKRIKERNRSLLELEREFSGNQI